MMRNLSKSLSCIFPICLAVSVVGGCGTAPANSTGSKSNLAPIKVGTLYPTSGSIALLGTEALNGAEIARQIVNQNGGVNGHPVQFVNGDAPDPTSAATEANRLITQDGVKILTGSLTSGNSLSATQVADRNQVFYWEATAIDDKITNRGYKYLFRFSDEGSLRGKAAVDLIVNEIASKLGVNPSSLRVAIVNEDSSYGQSIASGAVQEAQLKNINVVDHETYSSTATDLSGMVLRLKSKQPDVIIASSYINDATLFWSTAKQYGLNVKALIGDGSGYSDTQFAKVEGKNANGVISIDMPSNIPVNKLDPDVQSLDNEFHSLYEKQYHSSTVPLAAEVAFAGTYTLLHDVLPKAGTDDPGKLADAARSLNIAETINGWSVKFDSKGQNIGAAAVAYQWENGKLAIVWPDKLASASLVVSGS